MKMTKRILCLLLALVTIASLAACGNKSGNDADLTAPTNLPTVDPTVAPSTAPPTIPTDPASMPTVIPTEPSAQPTTEPNTAPSTEPTTAPTAVPTTEPSVPELPPVTDPESVSFYKAASHTASQTVSPGTEVVFYIVLINNASSQKQVVVTDQIPEVAEFVSGCDQVAGNQLTWNVTLAANERKTITYTLKAKNDEAYLGQAFESVAKVDAAVAPFYKIYIERTLGTTDQRLMKTAIDAFRQYTALEGLNLLKMIWNVAMSKSVSYNDANGKLMTPAQILNFIYTGEGNFGGSTGDGEEAASAAVDFRKAVIPTLYGGTGVTAVQVSQFHGVQANSIVASELMVGDAFFVQQTQDDTTGKIYIYNGVRLFLIDKGVIEVDTQQVLKEIPQAYRYAGLRFSYVIANRKSFVEGRNDTLTEAQQAIVAYAESMILRGDRAQYDAGSMMSPDKRYEYATNSPEDYTSDSWKYYNCANLTFDAYYFGLGLHTGNNWYTSNIIQSAKSQKIYYYQPTGSETEEQKQAQSDAFYAALQPGDTIVLRRKNDTGHALLYIGNGIVIHSTGGSYKSADTSGTGAGVEAYEATVRYLNVYDFFDAKCDNGGAYSYFVFGGQVTQFGIYRPLKSWKGTVPQEALNRANNLGGIAVEKIASKRSGQTVNIGEELTYYFRFLNANDVDKTLTITDIIPAGTTLLSANGATINGDNLSWTVTIPAGEKLEISYTVKVGENVPSNKLESRSATVGGVTVRSADLFVARTLTLEEQQKLINAANSLSGSSLRGLALANEIYKVAFGIEKVFAYTDTTNFHSQLFTSAGSGKYTLTDSIYADMAAPTLMGGRNCYCDDNGKYGRLSRMAREDNLIVGDILFGRTSSANGYYIYLGNGICWNLSTNKADTVPLQTRLERFVGYRNYWAVLRPSMVMDF